MTKHQKPRLATTFSPAEILHVAGRLEDESELSEMLGLGKTAEVQRKGAFHLRFIIRDLVRANHMTESEFADAQRKAEAYEEFLANGGEGWDGW